MSTQKRTVIVFLALAILLPVAAVIAQDEERDPVLEFYRERAAGQIRSRDPREAGVSYSLYLRAYVTKLGRGGKEEPVDSAVFSRYYTYGELDSQYVQMTSSKRLTEIDLDYPNVFGDEYDFYFYPNDTGGAALAIGFESDTVKNLSPVGLAVIDRTRYYLMRLYMYYPNSEKYERYSRTLMLRERQGLIFPDTLVVTYAESGIFTTDYYRTDLYVDSIHIAEERPDAP